LVESIEELGEVLAGELPVERLGDLVVVAFELVQGSGDLGGVVEVVGGERLALDDRVVDLGLIEPARVYWGVDEDQVRPAALEAVDRRLSAVVRTVVGPALRPRRQTSTMAFVRPPGP
jgi:hypothetical protein